jgi:DNA-directed RNA polymerase specialized sigma24 family protein
MRVLRDERDLHIADALADLPDLQREAVILLAALLGIGAGAKR